MKKIIQKIFGGHKQNKKDNLFPADWHLTISDLMDELKRGKRKEIKEPEMTWAREYERSLIPTNYRFPKKGDLYESKSDQTIEYLTVWSAPYTGGGTATIFRGEKIWIGSEPLDKKPIGSYAIPVDYKKLEERIIPPTDRTAFKYDGYYFHISTKTLNENFDLIQTDFEKEKYT